MVKSSLFCPKSGVLVRPKNATNFKNVLKLQLFLIDSSSEEASCGRAQFMNWMRR